MTIYIWLCVAMLTVLFYFDYWTTRNDLKRPGNSEANPRMVWLFKKFGMEHALILTKLGSLAIAVWLARSGEFNSRIGLIALTAVVLLYTIIVANNWRIYKSGV